MRALLVGTLALGACRCNPPEETEHSDTDTEEFPTVIDTEDPPSDGAARPSFAVSGDTVAAAWQEGDPPVIVIAWNEGNGWHTKQAADEDAAGAWNPTVALDADGYPLAAWEDHRAGVTDIYVSAEQATTRVDTDAEGDNNSVLPELVPGPDGRIALTWTDNRLDDLDIRYQGWTSIYTSVSIDRGVTWTEGRVDTGPYTEAPSVQPATAWDTAGRLYVAFLDARNGPFAVRVNRSEDDGATWLAEDLSVDVGPNLAPDLDADGDGAVALVWEDHTDVRAHVEFAWSVDGAQTFSPPQRLDSGDGPARDPVVWYDDDLVAIAWADHSDGAPDVHVAVSHDGVTFTETKLGDDEPGAAASIRPTIARVNADTLVVGWLDGRSGEYAPYLAISEDRGATWHEVAIESQAAASLFIAPAGERRLWVGWREARTDQDARVRVAKVGW